MFIELLMFENYQYILTKKGKIVNSSFKSFSTHLKPPSLLIPFLTFYNPARFLTPATRNGWNDSFPANGIIHER